MACYNWLERLKRAEKVGIIQDGRRKIHYKFPEGMEMVEEYNMDTNVLTRRAWRDKSDLRKNEEWKIEIGDPEPKSLNVETLGIKENINSPYVTMRITKTCLEWRIRNLPYSQDIYSVTAEPENRCITVRTSNKKYFKKISVPDLERAGVSLEQNRISFLHKYNTLIITYQKPQELLTLEKLVFDEVKKVKTVHEGDPQCKPS